MDGPHGFGKERENVWEKPSKGTVSLKVPVHKMTIKVLKVLIRMKKWFNGSSNSKLHSGGAGWRTRAQRRRSRSASRRP